MPYILNYADGSRTITVQAAMRYVPKNPIPPELQSPVSLFLAGKGAPNYGEGHQENMLQLLENFASDTPPNNPTLGQLWFDRAGNIIKVWSKVPPGPNTFGWQASGGSEVRIAYLFEYLDLAELYNTIAGNVQGTTLETAFGYGQVPITVTGVTSISNQDWKNLFTKFEKLAKHTGFVLPTGSNIFQHGATNGFIMNDSNGTTAGIVTELLRFDNSVQACNDLLEHRFEISTTSTESYADTVNGRNIRTAPWNTDIYHDVTFTFTSTTHMKQFFNAGGRLMMTPTLPAGAIPSEQTNLSLLFAEFQSVWINVLGTGNIGEVPLGTTNIGFYDLNASNKVIFLRYAGNNVAKGGYKLEAKTSGNSVVLRATFISPATGSMYAYSGAVTGTLTSASQTFKANEVYLNNLEIGYPVVSQAGTM